MSGYNHKSEIFTKEEIMLLIRHARTSEFRNLVILLKETGLRIHEALGLRKRDIDFVGDVAVLNVDGKTGPRAVPMCKYAGVVREMVSVMGEDELLFKKPYVTQRFRLGYLMGKLGMRRRASFHGIRHYAATKYMKMGMPEQIIKKMFGWTPESNMLRIYSHIGYADVIEYMKKINGHRRHVEGPFLYEVYN